MTAQKMSILAIKTDQQRAKLVNPSETTLTGKTTLINGGAPAWAGLLDWLCDHFLTFWLCLFFALQLYTKLGRRSCFIHYGTQGFPDYPNASGKIYWRWFEYTSFSLADGGSTGTVRSADYFRHYHDPSTMTQSVLLAFWAAIIMFLAYLVFSFIVSHYLLHRRSVLSASSK